MTLIKSISGIRGTIGGAPGEALTPVDIVKFTYAYCACLKVRKPVPNNAGRYKVVVGRDARISGAMVEQLVCGTLVACGVDVVKCGFASTPTTELAVTFAAAASSCRKALIAGTPLLFQIGEPRMISSYPLRSFPSGFNLGIWCIMTCPPPTRICAAKRFGMGFSVSSFNKSAPSFPASCFAASSVFPDKE